MERNDSGVIDFSRTIYEIRRHWLYYVVTFILFVGFGIFYIFKKNPVYQFRTTMLIEQGDGGSASSGMMDMMRTFSLGSFSGGSVDDEILVVESTSLMEEMVKELKLNRMYIEKDGIKNLPLYNNSPVEIKAPDAIFDTLSNATTLTIHLKPDGLADIKAKNGLFSTSYESHGTKLPTTVALPTGGVFAIEKTAFYKQGEDRTIKVVIDGTKSVAEYYKTEKITIDYSSKKSNGILCEIQDNNIARGKDILNKIVELYNRRRLGEKNDKTSAELQFLDNRLASLTGQLKDSELKLESFKSNNEITDIAEEARILLEQSTSNNKEIVQFQTQMAIFDLISDFLNDPANKYSMIPVTSGVEYESAAQSISSYNDLVMQRMRLDMSAKKDNKALQVLNAQIDAMRTGVVETINQAKQSAQIAYNDFLRERSKYTGRLKTLPLHEREFVELTRDREIKNSLYLFLIEQRESSLLKIGANYPIGRVVDVAYNEKEPIAPKKSIVFGLALIMSLLLPTLLFVYRSLVAKKIILKTDTKRFTNMIVAAEIAHSDDELIDYAHNSEAADSIRQLRNTILDKKAKTVMITSFLPESGKSFIATNLARVLSLSAFKIAVIDINPDNKVGTKLGCKPANGISEFVANPDMPLNAVTASKGNITAVDAGNNFMPEFMLTHRFAELLAALQQQSDFVIISTDSLSGNSSAAQAANFADASFVVVRSGQPRKLLEKFQNRITALDEEKTRIILNDLKA